MWALGCASWDVDSGKLLYAEERLAKFFGIRVGHTWDRLVRAPADLPLVRELLQESQQQIRKSLSLLVLGTQRLSAYLMANHEILVSTQLELKFDQFVSSSSIAYQCVNWQVWCETEAPVQKFRVLEVRQLSLPRRHSSGRLANYTEELCNSSSMTKYSSIS